MSVSANCAATVIQGDHFVGVYDVCRILWLGSPSRAILSQN